LLLTADFPEMLCLSAGGTKRKHDGGEKETASAKKARVAREADLEQQRSQLAAREQQLAKREADVTKQQAALAAAKETVGSSKPAPSKAKRAAARLLPMPLQTNVPRREPRQACQGAEKEQEEGQVLQEERSKKRARQGEV
jgi:hypothetical protein